MAKYITRTLTPKLLKFKEQFPVLSLFGPRQSGKTTLAKAVFPQYKYVNLESLNEREFAEEDPIGFMARFEKEEGVILDEIQKAPQLLSVIQVEVDATKSFGRFVLTGSQNLLLNQQVSQTLAGRTAIMTLLPLSIEELSKEDQLPNSYIEAIFKGFYPRIYQDQVDPVVFAESYLRTYVERDVRDISHINSLTDFQRFLRLCAARTGQLLNLTSLATESGLSLATVKAWLSILEATYVIFFLQPYFVNFNKRLVKMPKLYFYDTALACNLLKITHPDEVYDHYLRGGLFESLVISDLLKQRYNHTLPPNAYFWRDKTGIEVDCILERGAKLTPIEIKSTATITPDLFSGLNRWMEIADMDPSRGWIVYGGEDEQKRINGHVLPWKRLSKINSL